MKNSSIDLIDKFSEAEYLFETRKQKKATAIALAKRASPPVELKKEKVYWSQGLNKREQSCSLFFLEREIKRVFRNNFIHSSYEKEEFVRALAPDKIRITIPWSSLADVGMSNLNYLILYMTNKFKKASYQLMSGIHVNRNSKSIEIIFSYMSIKSIGKEIIKEDRIEDMIIEERISEDRTNEDRTEL